MLLVPNVILAIQAHFRCVFTTVARVVGQLLAKRRSVPQHIRTLVKTPSPIMSQAVSD
jgi:hypothetical protein